MGSITKKSGVTGTAQYLDSDGSYSLPSGISAGNLLALTVTSRGTNTHSTKSGWFQAGTYNSGGTGRVSIYLRIATGDSNDNFTRNDFVASDGWFVLEVAEGDIPSTLDSNALDVSQGVAGGSNTSFAFGALTTVTDGAFIVAAAFKNKTSTQDGNTNTAPSGWTLTARGTRVGNTTTFIAAQQTKATAGEVTGGTITTSAAAWSERWHAVTIAVKPSDAIPENPDGPGSGWTHFTQLSQDYALLPGEAPNGGPGWGTKAYLPDTVTAGTWVRYRGINDTDISSVSNLGVIAFVDQSDGDENDDTPYEFEWDLWDSGAWADDPTEFTFAFETFGGLLKDTFTAANDTNVNGREPDVQVGSNTWSRQKFQTSSPDPTLNVTIQSNRLACPEDQIGVEYDIGTRDFTMEVDWLIPSDAPSNFNNYICYRRQDGQNWLNINCRRSNGDLRLQRRINGATALVTSATGLTWAANTTYKLKIQCITNTVRVWRDNVLLIETQIDTNQSAGATKIWLGAAGGASASTPVLYDNLQVFDEFILLEPQVPSASTTLPPFGSTVSVGISPPGLVPQSAKWGGVTIPIANEDASGLDIVTPALTDYLPGGDFEDVDFVNGAEVTIEFASRPDLTIFVSPIPDESMNESGAEWWFGQAPSPGLDEQDEPLAASGIFAGFSLNESYLVRVTQGTITGITEAGVVQGPHPWTVELYRFVS